MAEGELGHIDLGPSTRLVFSIRSWQGKAYAAIRKFVSSQRYSGPTKSGILLAGEIAVELTEVLETIRKQAPGIEDRAIARIGKTHASEVVIQIVPPDDPNSLPAIDIREHLTTPRYTGPTKKGFRFPYDKLSEVIGFLEAQLKHLAQGEEPQQTLFPMGQPEWVKKAEACPGDAVSDGDVVSAVMPEGPREFPEGFLTSGGGRNIEVDLPPEPLETVQRPDGNYAVRSDLGFSHQVRNAVEGKFIVYASLRGHRSVQVPGPMIEIFRAVKAYEKYLRELRSSLSQAYERQTGHRPMAEHQTSEVFKRHGFPCPEA